MSSDDFHDLEEKGWIKVWLLFDTQAIDKRSLQELLKALAERIKATEAVKLVEENFSDVKKVDAVDQYQARGIKKAFSQVYECVYLVKDFETLVHLVINFGPSSLEILGPNNIKLDGRQMQNVLITIAEMMHRFALAGRGGVMITKV